MDLAAFSLVMFSAVLHAVWNFYAKKATANRTSTLWVGWLFAGIITTPFALINSDLSYVSIDWIPFILLTAVVHAIYLYLLGWLYSLGELSLTYPIARGFGILFTVLIILISRMEHIKWLGLLGILTLVTGIGLVSIKRKPFLEKKLAIVLAIMVGCCTSYYTIIDKVSIMHIPPALYISLMFLFTPILLLPFIFIELRTQTIIVLTKHKLYSTMIGLVSLLTYLLVLLALQTSPTPYVAALREISIVFVSLLGIFVLNEEHNRRKILGIVLILLGALIIKLS